MFYGMTPQEYIALQHNASAEMHYSSYWDTENGLVNLTKAGKLVVIDKSGRRERDWYIDTKTGKSWFPKYKNFKSLVKQIIREEGGL